MRTERAGSEAVTSSTVMGGGALWVRWNCGGVDGGDGERDDDACRDCTWSSTCCCSCRRCCCFSSTSSAMAAPAEATAATRLDSAGLSSKGAVGDLKL